MPRYNWTDDGYFNTERRDLGQIRRVLLVTMLLNFLATGIKMGVGIATGALSVVADSLDSLFDGLSNVVGLAGLYAASKPPDAEHPYGHRKFETLAALSISFLLFLTCWQLIQTAWSRLGAEVAIQVNAWAVGAMLLSMLVQLATSAYELREGRRLNSELLVADALHTRASILVSASVLLGLGLVQLGFHLADPILAGLVAVMIARIGVDILRETLPVLVDQAVVDPQEIARVVGDVEGVESFHRVRSRGAEGSAMVDLHVRILPSKTIQEADAIASEVRRRLLAIENITDVTVHLEAQRDIEADGADLFATLKHIAGELGITIHESWAHRLDGDLYLEVHVGVNPRLTIGQAHELVDALEKEVRVRIPEIRGVHTHIEMAEMQVSDDDRASEDLERLVRREVDLAVAGVPGLVNAHNVVVRHNRGERLQYYISLDCDVAPETPVGDAHRLSHLVEQELKRRLKGVVDVFIHLEPGGHSG